MMVRRKSSFKVSILEDLSSWYPILEQDVMMLEKDGLKDIMESEQEDVIDKEDEMFGVSTNDVSLEVSKDSGDIHSFWDNYELDDNIDCTDSNQSHGMTHPNPYYCGNLVGSNCASNQSCEFGPS